MDEHPLSIQSHDGNRAISGWLGDKPVSHVVQMLRDGFCYRFWSKAVPKPGRLPQENCCWPAEAGKGWAGWLLLSKKIAPTCKNSVVIE